MSSRPQFPIDFSQHMAYIFQLAIEQQEFIYIADSAPFMNSVCKGLFSFNESTQLPQFDENWPRINQNNSLLKSPTARRCDEDRRMQFLFDHFGKGLMDHEQEVDIVAVYIMTTSRGVSVDYMNRERLYAFLCSNTKPDGILQRYIMPQNKRQALLQIVWTKDLCLIEGRQNVHSIFDSNLCVSDRTATSASQPSKSAEIVVPKAVRARMTDLCRRVSRMLLVLGKEVRRMCVYFTMSSENCLVLLWCSLLEAHDLSEVRPSTAPGGVAASPKGLGVPPHNRPKTPAPMHTSNLDATKPSAPSEGKVKITTTLSCPATPASSPHIRPTQLHFPVDDPIWFEHGVWLDNLHPTVSAVAPPPPDIKRRHMVFINYDPIREQSIAGTKVRTGHDEECEQLVEGLRNSFTEFNKVTEQRNYKAKVRHMEACRSHQGIVRTLQQSTVQDPTLRAVGSLRPVSQQSLRSTKSNKVSPTPDFVEKFQKKENYNTDSIAEVRKRYSDTLLPHHNDLFRDYELNRRLDKARVQYVNTMIEDSNRRTIERGSRRPGQISISERVLRTEQEKGWDSSVIPVKQLHQKRPSPLEALVKKKTQDPPKPKIVVPPEVDTTNLAAPDGSLMNYMFNGAQKWADQHGSNQHGSTEFISPRKEIRLRAAKAQTMAPASAPSRRFTVAPPPIMDVKNPHKSISQSLLLEARKNEARPRLYDVITKIEKTEVQPTHSPMSQCPSPTAKEAIERMGSWRRWNVNGDEPTSPRVYSPHAGGGLFGNIRSPQHGGFKSQRGEYASVESKLSARGLIDAAEDMIYRAYSMALQRDTMVQEKCVFPCPENVSQTEMRSMVLALGFEEKAINDDLYFVLPTNHVRLSNALTSVQAFARNVDVLFDREHLGDHLATVRRLVETGLSFFDAVSDVMKMSPH